MSTLTDQRQSLFQTLRTEVRDHLRLRDVTSDRMQDRGHRSLVWDATHQPTGSHYFPVYVELFETLERRGEIDPDRHFIVETTTGNAGAAAAHVADRLGYDILIFMPENMPDGRIEDVRSYLGPRSELQFTEEGTYVSGMVRHLKRFLAAHRDGYRGKELYAMDHSRRSESVRAIRSATDVLLDERLAPNATVDACVLALGNGTTFSGVGQAARERFPDATLVGVEPAESPWFYVQKYGEELLRENYGIEPEGHQHDLLGTGGWGVEFPNLDLDFPDEIALVFGQEWRCMLDRLHDDGYPVGHSSAACQWIIEKQSAAAALSDNDAMTFLGIFYDPIEKYQ